MGKLLGLALTIVVAGAVLAGTVVALTPAVRELAAAPAATSEEIDVAALDGYAVRSQVYAADGTLLTALHGPENREPVALDRVPEPVVQAILAVEDAQFYDHGGVNFRGMARALVENVSAGGIEQGGSTITQQLVKVALLTSDRDLDRKLAEIPLALRLEQELTKDEILERYLNTIYFGSGAYGVQAAAETYWGVDVGQLGWAEGALLAAVIANPVGYDPTLHPERAYQQRSAALARMVEVGVVTEEEAGRARSAPLPVRRCDGPEAVRPLSCGGVTAPPPDTYFLRAVTEQLLGDPRIGETYEDRERAVFGGGLRIETTFDPRLQALAEQAVAATVPANDKGVVGAVVVVDTRTGAVRADVGGPGFAQHKYDITTKTPGRQTGSAFKPLVLLAALEQGNLPDDTIGGGGSFKNPGGTPDPYAVTGVGGTLASVTASSSNGAYVRLGQVVGLEAVADVGARLGLDGTLDPRIISMPLGTIEQTPLDLAGAYATIARGGEHVEPYFIERVEDRDGNVLIEHDPATTRALAPEVACRATQVLEGVVRSGTGTRARLAQQPAAGKTGTTEKNTDAWFVGYTPELTTAVWMGDPGDTPASMENLNGVANFGGTYPAMIWKAFNEPAHEGRPVTPFPTCPTPDRGGRVVQGQGKAEVDAAAGTGAPREGGTGPNTTTPAPAEEEEQEIIIRRSPPTSRRSAPTTTDRSDRTDEREDRAEERSER